MAEFSRRNSKKLRDAPRKLSIIIREIVRDILSDLARLGISVSYISADF
jgi:hypothetical protein